MAFIASSHGAQGRCSRASTRSQQGSVHESPHLAEGWSRDYLGKRLAQEECFRGKRQGSTSGKHQREAHRHPQTIRPCLSATDSTGVINAS
jgi:hypothetical protein